MVQITHSDYTQWQILEVEWHDAADEIAGWQDIEDYLEDCPVHTVKTIGYFLKFKNDQLYLTPTRKDDEMAVLSIIPEGCIIKMNPLMKAPQYEGSISVNIVKPEPCF